ncbi:hypothetical protein FB451DRAFT_1191264 [Mycena latifolia]|nr:hypothetical protein FB451DRAFT_1191264 [Mycena latifolia]
MHGEKDEWITGTGGRGKRRRHEDGRWWMGRPRDVAGREWRGCGRADSLRSRARAVEMEDEELGGSQDKCRVQGSVSIYIIASARSPRCGYAPGIREGEGGRAFERARNVHGRGRYERVELEVAWRYLGCPPAPEWRRARARMMALASEAPSSRQSGSLYRVEGFPRVMGGSERGCRSLTECGGAILVMSRASWGASGRRIF